MQRYTTHGFKKEENDGHKHRNVFILNTANRATISMGAFYRCGDCGRFPIRKKDKKTHKPEQQQKEALTSNTLQKNLI